MGTYQSDATPMTKKIGTCIDVDLVEPFQMYCIENQTAQSRIISALIRDFLIENGADISPDHVLNTRSICGKRGASIRREALRIKREARGYPNYPEDRSGANTP